MWASYIPGLSSSITEKHSAIWYINLHNCMYLYYVKLYEITISGCYYNVLCLRKPT